MQATIDWIIRAASALLLAILVGSWLASYRRPKAAPVRSSDWFFVLPTWAQIAGGLGGCALLAYAGRLLWIPLPSATGLAASAVLAVAGLALFLAGSLLVLWARWALGSMYGVSTSFVAPLQAQHRLIRHGPYAVVRHPLYLGLWVVLLGALLVYATWTLLVMLVICLAAFYRRARREEVALAARFGEEWRVYAAHTKFIIPLLY